MQFLAAQHKFSNLFSHENRNNSEEFRRIQDRFKKQTLGEN
jgi:hypothetical protein